MNDAEGGAPNADDRSRNVTERIGDDVAEEQRLSEAVVELVGVHTGDDPFEMEPLNDAIDTDALDALFGSLQSGIPRTGGTVEFDYHGCRVTVHSDGGVVVRDRLPR